MTYFKPKSFLLSLRNLLSGQYAIEKASSDREPLKYKISGSDNDVAYLSFGLANGKVIVNLDFAELASQSFITEISEAIGIILKSGYGDTDEMQS